MNKDIFILLLLKYLIIVLFVIDMNYKLTNIKHLIICFLGISIIFIMSYIVKK